LSAWKLLLGQIAEIKHATVALYPHYLRSAAPVARVIGLGPADCPGRKAALGTQDFENDRSVTASELLAAVGNASLAFLPPFRFSDSRGRPFVFPARPNGRFMALVRMPGNHPGVNWV